MFYKGSLIRQKGRGEILCLFLSKKKFILIILHKRKIYAKLDLKFFLGAFMFSFFSRNRRAFFLVSMSVVAFSMLFYGISSTPITSASVKNPDTVYITGTPGKQKRISKQKIEGMKTYLSYDFGYDMNDALEKQNIFSDGFFFTLMDSSFGRGLVDIYFPLLKDDFEKRMAINRKTEMYRHPMGKLNIEDEVKRYANDFYVQYQKVKDKKREIDASLLKDCIFLCSKHRYFRPRDIKLLTKLFIRDRKIEEDPTVEKRNYALFGAKSNTDIFGEAFMELAAQSVLVAAAYAEENGYYTSSEEAHGVITRRALDVIGEKFKKVTEKKELTSLKEKFRDSLGLSEQELIEAARAVITFQKMIKDVDTTILIDNFTAQKLYGNQVDQLLVKVMKTADLSTVKNSIDALELHTYLEAIGKTEGFLSVPERVYEQKELFERNPNLLMKNYQVKAAKITKTDVASTLSLKKVWDFQVSDKGWADIRKKFYLDELSEKEKRFSFLRSLDKKKEKEIESYSRRLLLEMLPEQIEITLKKRPLRKMDICYNKAVSTGGPYKDFDIEALAKKFDGMKEGERLSCYSQNGEDYFYFVLLKKTAKEQFPTLAQARKNGYLTALVEQKLKVLNHGKEVNDDNREKLVRALLKKEAGEVAIQIIAAQEQGKCYTKYKEDRIRKWKEGVIKNSTDPILSQFNIEEKQEIIDRSGNNKQIAKEEFFLMQEGDSSDICYLGDGEPYYISFIARKLDKEKLSQVKDTLAKSISLESRDVIYKEILSEIIENKQLVIERLKKEF